MRVTIGTSFVLCVFSTLLISPAQAVPTWIEDYESYSPGPLAGDWTFDAGSIAHTVTAGIGWNGSQGITGPNNSVTWMARTFDVPVAGNSYEYSFKLKPDTGTYIGAVLGGGSGLYLDLRYWNTLPTAGTAGLLYYNAELFDHEIVLTTTEWLEARSSLTPSGGGWLQVDEYRVYDSGSNVWGAWQSLGQTTTPWNFEAGRNYVRTTFNASSGVVDDVAFVPEPAALTLIGIGGLLLFCRLRARQPRRVLGCDNC